MANKIVQAIYDLKDNITGKLKTIGDALRGHKSDSDKTTAGVENNNKRLSESYAGVGNGIGKLRAALGALAAFVGLEKLKDQLLDVANTGEKFDDLEKKLATAFGGIDAGKQAFSDLQEFAKGVPLSFEQVIDSAVKLRQQGFNPLDGTLQALIDNQQALDGSFEDLITTIDTLGKANEKGELSLKAIVTLTQQGIPVFELLSKATGNSEERIRQLANSGQLGQDAIKALITELGKVRTGAAASELGDLDGQFQKLKDSAEEFKNEIAKSGFLDVFRAKLADLNQAVSEAAASGKLKEVAQKISDGIISTANAIGSAIKFVYDYSDALIAVGKAYASIKVASFLASLATTTASLAQAAAAALSLRTATAATSASTAAATGAFATLGGVLRSVFGFVIANPVIALIGTAAAFTTGKLIDLVGALADYNAMLIRTKEIEADLADSRANLLDKIAKLKEANQQYADTAIASAEELKNKSEEQLKSYQVQLDGAITFYRTLRTEAKVAGDAAGFQEATAQLGKYQAELDLTKQAIIAVGNSLQNTLSAGAAAVAKSFDGAAKSADAVTEGVKKLFEAFDETSFTHLGEIGAGLAEVSRQSDDAANNMRNGLGKALESLSGEQLLKFQSAAVFAFDNLKTDASAAAVVLDTTLQAAMQRLGVSADSLGVAFTNAGKDAIATFTAVSENARASGAQIEAAFKAAVLKTSTLDEAKQLGDLLADAGARGKLGFEQTERAGAALERQIQKISEGLNPLNDAFSTLGIKSQQSLDDTARAAQRAFNEIVDGSRRGLASQEDVRRAFEAYAKTAIDAAKDSTGFTQSQVAEQLNLQASIFGLTDAFKASGLAGDDAGKKIANSYESASQSIDSTVQSAGNVGDSVKSTSKDLDSATDSADNLGNSIHDVEGVAAALSDAVKSARAEFSATSEAAGKLFDKNLVDFGKTFINAISGIAGAAQAIDAAANLTRQKIDEERQSAEGLAEQYSNLSDAAVESAVKIAGGYDQAASRLRATAEAARDGYFATNLLGKSDLSGLASAAEQAAQKILSIKQQAEDAKASLDDLGKSIQDELDRASGNDVAIEDRRFQDQLKKIEELARKGGASAQQQAAQIRDLALKEHQQKLAEIEQRKQAEIKANSDIDKSKTTIKTSGSSSSGAGGLSGAFQNQQINFYIQPTNLVQIGDDKKTSEMLARSILPHLNAIFTRSR